jgi:6-phosphofructokinase 1
VAANLKEKMSVSRPYGLVVVAEGARSAEVPQDQADEPSANPLKDSLSPLASGDSSEHVIQRSGQVAKTVARRLQLLLPEETYPIVLGPLVRGGPPTATDRQLGLAYGAGAVAALEAGKDGVMVAFAPPNIDFVPLTEAINRVRTVPADSEFMQIARALNISLGSAQ